MTNSSFTHSNMSSTDSQFQCNGINAVQIFLYVRESDTFGKIFLTKLSQRQKQAQLNAGFCHSFSGPE